MTTPKKEVANTATEKAVETVIDKITETTLQTSEIKDEKNVDDATNIQAQQAQDEEIETQDLSDEDLDNQNDTPINDMGCDGKDEKIVDDVTNIQAQQAQGENFVDSSELKSQDLKGADSKDELDDDMNDSESYQKMIDEETDFIIEQLKTLFASRNNYSHIVCGRHLKNGITKEAVLAFGKEFPAYGIGEATDGEIMKLIKKLQ